MEISQINEEEIINKLNQILDNYNAWIQDNETDTSQLKWFILEKQAIKGLLDLYKKKSKMIEIMAENLTTPTHDKEWVIKYFEGEVELEEENDE